MALLAKGLYMASHPVAVGLSTLRNSPNQAFSFGTGKANVLGGYTGTTLRVAFALPMVFGSVSRRIGTVDIILNRLIAVAVLGMLINGVRPFILGLVEYSDDHDNGHGAPSFHANSLRTARAAQFLESSMTIENA